MGSALASGFRRLAEFTRDSDWVPVHSWRRAAHIDDALE
jgi:hypothetical protein